MDLLSDLQTHFGHDSFRQGQEDVVRALLGGESALALFPTGAGKQSATFVGPAAKSESALHFTNRLSKPRVGFHAINFDYEVVVGYTVQDLPHLCHTLDLLVGIGKPPGHRLGLDAVASASPGVGKTGDGLDAIRWWREGKLLEIAEYCCFDVKCTKLAQKRALGVVLSARVSG